MSDRIELLLRRTSDQSEKKQWLNVLAILNELTGLVLKEFNDVLKRNEDVLK